MKHLTRTKVTQICKRVEAGQDMAEVATAYGCTIERVESLTGTKRKKKRAAKPKEEKPEEGSAADDFS